MYLFYFHNHKIIEPKILSLENSSGIYMSTTLFHRLKKNVNHLEVLLEVEPAFSEWLDTIMWQM